MASWEGQLLPGFVLLVAGVASYLFLQLYNARMLARSYQRRGLPVAPNHNFLFRHLLYLKSQIDALPPNAHYQYAFGDIGRKHFVKEGCFYLDAWPITGLIMVNFSPHVAFQSLNTSGTIAVTRPSLLPRFFKPIAGGPNLFDLRENEWRPWRAVFIKGFNTEQVSSLIPGMVKETQVYCKTLERLAEKGETFSLDATTLRLTMDLIGKTILNTSLRAQEGYNALADCMLNQIRWHQANAQTNPFSYFNFVRWYIHWSNGRNMDQYCGKPPGSQPMPPTRWEVRCLKVLDSEFRTFAIRQIRLFVFVGHDSTSSTICYIVHLLFSNQEKLHLLRAELNSVFGTTGDTASKIVEQQYLLNRLPYTTAVIKESLRLFPPASASREGQKGVEVVNDAGQSCPTEGAFILTIHTELQRAAKYWPKPDEFIPERFIVEPGHELRPLDNAWRPFEKGPRNCMAEGLVMTELKIVLAIVLSRFDFADAYEKFDRLQGPKKKAKRTCGGLRAYQIEEGAAHPVDGYPCKVSLRGGKAA